MLKPEPQNVPQAEPLLSEESKHSVHEIQENALPQESSETVENSDNNSNSSPDSEEERVAIPFKLPLQLDFDDLAAALMEKNQKSKLNCVVEKKRADEIIDHQPKTAQLPFGINLTTDPRYEHISGERIAIVCESGNVQR